VPLEHLETPPRTKHVDLEVVFLLRVPQPWGLPVDRPHQISDHWPGWLFGLGESEICDPSNTFNGDGDVGGSVVSVGNRQLMVVEVLNPMDDVEHHAHLTNVSGSSS
jgi:hypothetical protein